MPAWVWVPLALFLFSSGCFALLWVAILGGKQHDQAIDARVHVVADGPQPGCGCEDCEAEREPDMDEFELRAHMAYDRYRFQYKAPGERP